MSRGTCRCTLRSMMAGTGAADTHSHVLGDPCLHRWGMNIQNALLVTHRAFNDRRLEDCYFFAAGPAYVCMYELVHMYVYVYVYPYRCDCICHVCIFTCLSMYILLGATSARRGVSLVLETK